MVYKYLYIWFLVISQFYSLSTISLLLYLTILCSLYLLWFTINTYLQCCNIPVLNTPLFRAQLCKKISLILLFANIVLILLNLFSLSLLSLLLGPSLLLLRLPWLLITLVYSISSYTIQDYYCITLAYWEYPQ